MAGEKGGGRATRRVEGLVGEVGADGQLGEQLGVGLIDDAKRDREAAAVDLGKVEKGLRHVLNHRAGEVVHDVVAGSQGRTMKKTAPITLLKTRRGAPTIDESGPDRSRNAGGDPDGSKADEVNHLLDEPRETDSPRKVVPTGSHPAFKATADGSDLRAGGKPGLVNTKAQLALGVFSN